MKTHLTLPPEPRCAVLEDDGHSLPVSLPRPWESDAFFEVCGGKHLLCLPEPRVSYSVLTCLTVLEMSQPQCGL